MASDRRAKRERTSVSQPVPAPADCLQHTELVCQQTFVTAGSVVPVAPVHAALVAAENLRLGQTRAQPPEQTVGLALQTALVWECREVADYSPKGIDSGNSANSISLSPMARCNRAAETL